MQPFGGAEQNISLTWGGVELSGQGVNVLFTAEVQREGWLPCFRAGVWKYTPLRSFVKEGIICSLSALLKSRIFIVNLLLLIL